MDRLPQQAYGWRSRDTALAVPGLLACWRAVSTDAKYSLPRSTGERNTKSAGSVIEPERNHPPGNPGAKPV
jgi:hypothetical protein